MIEVQKQVRKFERLKTRLQVRYGPTAPERSDRVETISEGGLYINTNDVSKVGTRLLLEIEFPDRVVTQRGEVVWAIQVPEHLRDSLVCGIGIEFVYPGNGWATFFRGYSATQRARL